MKSMPIPQTKTFDDEIIRETGRAVIDQMMGVFNDNALMVNPEND